MPSSFLDQLTGLAAPSGLGDLFGNTRGGGASLGDLFGSAGGPGASLNDLFGATGAGTPSLGNLFGGPNPAPLLPSLGDLFGGVNPGAPSIEKGFAEIKAAQQAKTDALNKSQAAGSLPGTVNPQNPTSAAAPSTGAPLSGFFQQHLPYAQQALQTAGWNPDLAPVLLGIAANEGGAAGGTLANAPYHNLFGIKATPDWTGGTVQMPTTEYVNGAPVQQQATFRTYPSPAESWADHIAFLQQNPRYASALQQQGSPRDFLNAVAAAGYATDPNWASKVWSLAQQASSSTAPTGPAVPLSSAARGDQVQSILANAQQWVGVPYVWGGTTRAGADCSGFITSVFREMGMQLPGNPRDAEGIRRAVQPVDASQVQPGDLVFFQGTDPQNTPSGASHVGIVTQQGVMTDSSGNGVAARQFATSPYWQGHLLGYGRPPQYGP